MVISSKPETIDEYIAMYSSDTQGILEEVRQTIRAAAPDATEAISYGIPTFKRGGKNLVHFAAFPHHIGFYATPDGHTVFEKELARYHVGKGSVQFPLDKPLPLDLIARIVTYRVEQLKS